MLAFSDPAGAKACLALAAILEREGFAGKLSAFSNKSYDFYADWHMPVTVVSEGEESFHNVLPDWIFTGTSHPDSSGGFEWKLLKQAQEQGIFSVAFVDHWTSIGLRFQLKGETVLPDEIWLIDEHAKEAALRDGLPENRLRIRPNPYLEYIARYWQPQLNMKTILAEAGINATRYVLYAPDPVSLRNANGEWLFDEYSALADLLQATAGIPGLAVLVKPHPLQDMEALRKQMNSLSCEKDVSVAFAPRIDNLELMNGAALIVGFHSNFLIEAAALDKKILRYFPNSEEKDAIAHLSIGEKIGNALSLNNKVKAHLS